MTDVGLAGSWPRTLLRPPRVVRKVEAQESRRLVVPPWSGSARFIFLEGKYGNQLSPVRPV
jgi:hypothetical protein